MVIIQEIVAPPDMQLLDHLPDQKHTSVLKLPDGRDTKPQPMVTDFFLAMQAEGFDQFWLSEEDTGPIEENNNNGSATEWWAVFYRSDTWLADRSLPHGFLAKDVTNNPTYDRVPYAFSFKSVSGNFDFVVVNVHLRPGAEAVNKARRAQEIRGIADWIDEKKKQTQERDFFIAGDCNLEDGKELLSLETETLKSLNIGALAMTNTNRNAPKPYDHVFISPEHTAEISMVNNFEVIDLVVGAKPFWERSSSAEFPGGLNYNHNLFRFYYSDHLPVAFVVDLPNRDDD
jgi:hypothetical protein